MKTYGQLTQEQKEIAKKRTLDMILTRLINGESILPQDAQDQVNEVVGGGATGYNTLIAVAKIYEVAQQAINGLATAWAAQTHYIEQDDKTMRLDF